MNMNPIHQVNRRRLAPGSSQILRDGDTVFFSLCMLKKPKDGRNPPPLRYENNEDYTFTYHQYTSRPPPLSLDDQGMWTGLNTLEQSCWRIDDEIDRLKREKEALVKKHKSLSVHLFYILWHLALLTSC